MSVGVVKANYFDIKQKMRQLLRLINYKPKHNLVVLKPNAASAYGHYLLGDYTSPQLLETFIWLFPEKEFIIAEGAAVGMKFLDAARILGYERLVHKYRNVRLLDLEQEERVELDWKFGKIRIPRIVLENEYVNCPKMKTHHLCTVTLGMKNQKGLLDTKMKKMFHLIDIHEAIRELGSIVQPALTLVDGLIALEGNGPNSITAKPKLMGVLIAGSNMIEVDNVCIRLMSIPPEIVKHIPQMNVEAAGEKIKNVRKQFELPRKTGKFLKFGNVYYTCGCSGCLESLSGGIRGMLSPSELYHLPEHFENLLKHIFIDRLYLFMGADNTMPEKKGTKICIGNCTKKFADKYNLPFFPGCPPKPSSLSRLLDNL